MISELKEYLRGGTLHGLISPKGAHDYRQELLNENYNKAIKALENNVKIKGVEWFQFCDREINPFSFLSNDLPSYIDLSSGKLEANTQEIADKLNELSDSTSFYSIRNCLAIRIHASNCKSTEEKLIRSADRIQSYLAEQGLSQ